MAEPAGGSAEAGLTHSMTGSNMNSTATGAEDPRPWLGVPGQDRVCGAS